MTTIAEKLDRRMSERLNLFKTAFTLTQVFPPAFTVTKAGAPEAAEAFKQHVVAMLKRLGKEDLKEEGLRQIEEMWMFEKDLINVSVTSYRC